MNSIDDFFLHLHFQRINMTISYRWLQNYIQTKATLEKIVATLTAIGLEVEDVTSFEFIKGGLKGLVIGEVLSKEKHPNAEKLSCTIVDLGTDKGIQKIVCGASNVTIGQKVVVAPVGCFVHSNEGASFEIKAAKIRGEESNGMICAEDEIGLGSSHEGIMVLPSEATVGLLASTYFNIDSDTLLEINLTPNRTDAMSHIGVARDLAAGLNASGIEAKFVKPDLYITKESRLLPINITVNSPSCLRYTAVVISNLKLQATPKYIIDALAAIGVNSINAIVDITNFVLHEYGQPLHAFDTTKINGAELHISDVKDHHTMLALDGSALKLQSGDVVIKDDSKILCLAGIYGAKDCSVTEQTNSVLLESAFFTGTSVRSTSQRLNLRTDAAQKFEKGTDINITVEALQRALFLIKESYPDVLISEIKDQYPQPIQPVIVILRLERLKLIAGRIINLEKIKSILISLGIKINSYDEKELNLSVPTFKIDIKREEDIIEEILRIDGYNHIPFPAKLNANISFSKGISNHTLIQQLGDFLTGKGMNEIMCNTITSSKYIDAQKGITLVNSMTSALNSLRSSMLYGGLEIIQFNNNREIKDLSLFEFGSVYSHQNEKYKQQQILALWQTGKNAGKNWLTKQRPIDYYDIKSTVENLLQKFTKNSFTINESQHYEFSYGIEFVINQQIIAQIGKIKANLIKEMDLKQDVFFASIDIDQLLKLKNKEKILYEEVSKFPAVRRDLAMIIDEAISFDKISNIAYKSAKNLIQDVSLFDVYKGDNIESGKKSYAVSFKLVNESKTLTDKEIDKTMADLIRNYENELKAVIRTA